VDVADGVLLLVGEMVTVAELVFVGRGVVEDRGVTMRGVAVNSPTDGRPVEASDGRTKTVTMGVGSSCARPAGTESTSRPASTIHINPKR
jgi:hypothetical protein